ncbi:glycosyltransferase [Rhodobacter capsulatus]|uniref:Glycosyltransferase n=1 Tax=Rhodobacter capsulatus TaxID=1061 RepID=A0A4V5PQ04_RHOCA|nr:glycosyltransferase [Rhodobacter capsulatus]TKD21619.1 glycosyltransferase [Rhodobacter capsulatus]
MKPVIVFVSAVTPGQFNGLAEYLHTAGLAETWYLTSRGHLRTHGEKYKRLLPFAPEGQITGPQGYYYSDKTERSARISRGVLAALTELRRKTRIDLVFAHGMWGAPLFLFDEIDAAIASYVEFPSYAAHGWDRRYPPDQSQRLADRNMEMLSFHQILKSDLTIMPSAHARSLLPLELQPRVAVQFEGFEIKPLPPAPPGPFTIGFSARDLSNCKGFDIFVRLVDRLVREGTADRLGIRFAAIGDPKATTYGYEQQWIDRNFRKGASFAEYLVRTYPAGGERILFPGKLPYDTFVEALAQVDLFLYPLRFGVGNWGLMEILARGKPVIASNATFAPEMIEDGVNGVLLPVGENGEDDQWIAAIERLATDPALRARLGAAAAERGRAYHLDQVAPRYMALFEQAIETGKRRMAGG